MCGHACNSGGALLAAQAPPQELAALARQRNRHFEPWGHDLSLLHKFSQEFTIHAFCVFCVQPKQFQRCGSRAVSILFGKHIVRSLFLRLVGGWEVIGTWAAWE